MTNQEFTQEKERLEVLRFNEERRLKEEIARKYEAMLKPFKEERIKTLNTNNIQIGDIITDGLTYILVERIIYAHSRFDGDSFLEFRGMQYTKALKPKARQDVCFVQQRYGVIPTIIKKAKEKKNDNRRIG